MQPDCRIGPFARDPSTSLGGPAPLDRAYRSALSTGLNATRLPAIGKCPGVLGVGLDPCPIEAAPAQMAGRAARGT